jgi:hypothetical protein
MIIFLCIHTIATVHIFIANFNIENCISFLLDFVVAFITLAHSLFLSHGVCLSTSIAFHSKDTIKYQMSMNKLIFNNNNNEMP